MNRNLYFNYIEEKLSTLALRIEMRGKLNILDLHLYAEDFYLHFFNVLFSWKLENLNLIQQNVEAIDLIDHTNRIVIQVSSTCTKSKIESALSKGIISNYSSYNFKFISLSKDASELRKMTFSNPYNIVFSPLSDIYDLKSILNSVLALPIDSLNSIYQFIKKELGGEIDIVRLESNLATIINVLSKENWSKNNLNIKTNSFEIDRKISHNNLLSAKYIIDDYRIHYGRVDNIYSEFDVLGSNKSSSVLSSIRGIYLKQMRSLSDDKLFYDVIEKVQEKVLHSSNYIQIPIDELELCINILVVDAFVRCKIFENPINYDYVTT